MDQSVRPPEAEAGAAARKPSEGGTGFVDMDEFAHFTSMANRYGQAVVCGDFRGEQSREINELVHRPSQWFSNEGTPNGNPVLGFPLDIFVGLFSVLAIQSGAEEIGEANNRKRELTAKREETLNRLNRLRSALADSRVGKSAKIALRLIEKLEMRSLNTFDESLRHTACDRGIGISALTSGLAIFARTAGDFTLRIVTLATTGGVGTIAATTALGIVGTLAFGPIAAVAAVALGSYFVHQTRKVGAGLRQDRELFEKVAHKAGQLNLKEMQYAAFVERKLASRERFATRFKRWNVGFLSGACLCALATGAKAALGVAALAGVAAAVATPIVLP
ncbi:MAG TPA: hypothetical protein VL424_10670 [Pararobbsia sp.]|nr:hypothetical protein [Pararobbsia sp.]